VVKLKDVHAKRKTSHSAAPAVAASNLLQAAAVKSDSHLSRKGFTFLSHVATAVCEDCDKCQELRSEAEAAERWRATKAAAAAAASQSKKKKGESAGHKRSRFPLPCLSRLTTAVEMSANHAPRALGAGREPLEANGSTSVMTATAVFTRSAWIGNTCATQQEAQLGFSCADCVAQRCTPTWPTGNDSRD